MTYTKIITPVYTEFPQRIEFDTLQFEEYESE